MKASFTASVIWALALLCLCCGCGAGGGLFAAPGEKGLSEMEPVKITPKPAATLYGQTTMEPEVTPDAPIGADEAWVLFINVKKADAALICVEGCYYLIDTGTKESADELVALMKELGVDRLSGLFLTHSHKDHVGGAKAVCAAFPVDMVYRSQYGDLNEKSGSKLMAELGLPQGILMAGEAVTLPGGAALRVLGPVVYNGDDDNDNSLVLLLEVNGARVLFTGDMQLAQEQSLIRAGIDLSANVLKVGNHGNPDATGEAFAGAVGADIAVISTNRLLDEDSANQRVIRALAPAEIYITENDAWGVKITISKGAGTQMNEPNITAAYAAPPMEERADAMVDSYYTALINRKRQISPDFVPQNLITAEKAELKNITLSAEGIRGDEEAMLALRAMLTAAEADSVNGFYLVSVYRDYAHQRRLWDRKVERDPSYGVDESAPIAVAYPGASEHQTGLAFDISALDAQELTEAFSQTPQGKWLYANCHKFGFILRYPKGSEAETAIVFEPWHFRYVGMELAGYLAEHNMTLEKFYQTFCTNNG